MANTRTIEFKGHFDGKQVLDELKKIRQNMADAGADDNLFKGIDKDIAATEKLVTEMMAQIQKGFSNTKEVNAFEKQIDKLQTNFLKISSGMQNINIAENFGLNSPEINKLTKEIEQLTAAQDHLKEVSKNALDQAQKSIGLRNDEVAEIKKAIDANEDLEEALKKVGKAKEKAALASVGSKAAKTDAGKEYLSGASVGLSLEDLGATASSGKSVKKKNDARKRYDNGELYGSAGNRELDETKANAAINEAYQKTLEKMVTTGGNAAEAIEEMKKALADYGIEIENVDKLQENFYSDIEGFYKSPAVSGGAKSAVTKARKIGQTDAQGNYQLSENSMTNLVNNEEITASSRATQELGQKVQELGEKEKKAQEEAAKAAQQNSESLQDVNKNIEDSSQALKEGSDATRDATENQNKLNDSFDNMKGAIKTFLSIGSAISALRNVIRNTFNDIKELDKSFANIAMVTDYSVGQMWESYDQYAKMANELGQSTKSVIEASGLFYQQGLDTADSLALTEDTMKLATLAGLDFAEATSQMTAALRGFHMEMDEGGRVTDVYSELAAKAAADVEGIAYAMSKTASIASSAGMEFETTSAFLTQMIETTQEAPENIGTAMKTIIARFTELKENVAGTADSEFDDLDYNKVDTALKSVGISLKDASGQFRNLDDVFLELSQKWNTLDRNSQRYIATIAAGSRQQSRFIAMMENYDRTMELVDTAYDSAGKSSEQFAKYQDTVEYKINQISNSWEQLRTNFFNSNTYKTALDIVQKFVDTLNNLDLKQLLGIGVVGLTLGKTVITNFIKGVQSSISGLQEVFNKTINKVLSSQKIQNIRAKLHLDSSDADQKIKQTSQRIEDLKRVRMTIISDNTDVIKDIDQIKAKLAELKAQDPNATFKMAADEFYRGQENGTVKANTANRVNQSLNQNTEDIEEQQRQQELAKKQQLKQQQLGQAAGQAFATSMTAAITSIAIRENPGEVFGDVIVSGLVSMIPVVISTATTMGMAMAAATAGISLLVTALVGGIAAVGKFVSQSVKQKEVVAENSSELLRAKKNIEALTEAQEDLDQQLNETNNRLSEQKTKYELLAKNEEKLTEYANAYALTNEEQQEYVNISNEIAESFPELIDYYDEQGNAILKMGESWEQAKTKQQEYYAEAQKEQGIAQVASDLNKLSLLENQKKESETTYSNLLQYQNQLQAMATTQKLEQEGAVDEAYEWDGEEFKWTDSLENFRRTFTFATAPSGVEASLLNIMLGYKDNLKGDPDKGNESKEIADLINKSLTEAGFQEFENLSPEDTFNAFIDAIQNDTELARDYQEALQKGTEALLAQGEVSQSYNDEISEAEDVVNNSIKENLLTGDLLSQDVYIDASENVKNVIKSGLVEDLDLDITALKEKWKGEEGSSYSNYYNLEGKLKSSDADAQVKADEAFVEWLSKTDEYQSVIADTLSGYDENTQEIIDEYYTDLDKLNIKERIDKIQTLDVSDDIKEDMMISEEDNIKAYNDSIEKLSNLLGANFKTNVTTGLNVITTSGLENIDKFSDSFITSLEKNIGELPQELRPYFQDSFTSLMSNLELSNDEMAAMFSIDWSQVTFTNKEDFKKKISEMYTEETGEIFPEEKLNKEFDKLQKWFKEHGIIELDATIAESAYTEIEQQLSDLSKTGDTLLSGLKESLENNFLSFDTIINLKTQFGDVFDEITAINDEGMLVLDSEGMEDYFSEAINQQILNNNEVYQEKVARLEAYEAILNNIEATATQAEVQRELNRLIKSGTTDSNIKKLITSSTELFDMSGSKLQEKYELEKQQLKDFEDQYKLTQDEINSIMTAFMREKNDIIADSIESNEKDADSLENLIKAQEEYNEVLHGTAEWLDKNDPFKAMADSISILEKKLEGLKEDLNNITTPEQSKDILNAITENRAMQIENLTGQIQASQSQYEQVLDFIQNGDYSQYYSQLPDGTIAFDITKWYNEGGSDEMGDALGEMATKGNDAAMQILESQQKINSIQDEQQKESEERLKNYTSLQDQILDILKKNAEEEVKTQKEKYENLKQADDDYLSALEDAIEKQRQLREKEKDYEELATKEKKLSLMQRDTSGANQKEINQLQQEVEDQRQELLDNKIDEMIDKLREQSELQTEMRDLEIEIKENELESNNFLSELAAVESSFHNTDDIVEWMLKNNKELEDMSIEQQEAKILEWQELGTSWAAYLGEKEEGYSNLLTTSEENIENFAQIGVDAIEGSINRIITNEEAAQLERENDAKKALEEAEKNYNKAVGLLEDYWAKAAQAGENKEEANNEKNKQQEEYDNYMKNAHNASFEGYLRTQGLDVQEYRKYKKYSPNATQDSFLASKGINIKTKQGYVPTKQEENNKSSNPLYNEINKEKTDIKEIVRSNKEKIYGNSYNVVKQTLSKSGYKSTKPGPYSRGIELVFDTGETLFYEGITVGNEITSILDSISNKIHGIQTKIYGRDATSLGKKYATGGLVNYTGPAWVDGTPAKPEAFLNAQDTQRIGEAAKILAQIPALNGASENVSTNIGDTTIEIHINVENIESDYDVDQMIERVKNDIIDVSKPIGTSVILKK